MSPAVFRNHVEAPDHVAIAGVERVDVSRHPDGIAPRVAHVYPAVGGNRCHGNGDSRSHDIERTVPEHMTIAGIQRHHMRIRGPAIEAAVQPGKAAVDGQTRWGAALVVPAPLLLAGGGVDRVGALVAGEIHGAVDDQRSGLERDHFRQRVHTVQRQLPGIRGGDVGQRRVAVPGERAVVRGPIRRLSRRRRRDGQAGCDHEHQQSDDRTTIVLRHARSP